MAAGEYEPEDDEVFVEQQIGPLGAQHFQAQYEALSQVYRAAPSQWAKHTLAGAVAVARAWKLRGGGFASTVSREGWEGFATQMGKAREAFEAAWRLRTDRPQPAARMIEIERCDPSKDDDLQVGMRQWFDRAVAAQCDYQTAYEKILWFNGRRWGGSHEWQLAFGLACAATKRYDLEIPVQFTRACNLIACELDDWRTFYRQPKVARALVEVSQGLVNEPTRVQERWMRESFLAVNAWLAGEFALAEKTFAALNPPRLHPEARKKLRRCGFSEAWVRREVGIELAGVGAAYATGKEQYQRGNLGAAREAWEQALTKTSGPAAELLTHRLAIVQAERTLATGRWVAVVPDAELLEWDAREGEWSVTPDGTLVNHGTDAQALIVYRARVGPEFELRAHYEVEAKENCCQSLGVAFAWRSEWQGMRWETCGALRGGRCPLKVYLLDRHWGRDELVSEPLRMRPRNELFMRVSGGKVTFQFNGQTIWELPVTILRYLVEGCGSVFLLLNLSQLCLHQAA